MVKCTNKPITITGAQLRGYARNNECFNTSEYHYTANSLLYFNNSFEIWNIWSLDRNIYITICGNDGNPFKV